MLAALHSKQQQLFCPSLVSSIEQYEALSFVLSHLSLIDVGQNGHKPEVLFAGLGEVTGEGWGGEGMGTAAQAAMYHPRYGKFITGIRLQFGTK